MLPIIPWLLSAGLLVLAYPMACWLLGQSPLPGSRLLATALALALGSGLLTLILFWQMLPGISPTPATILIPYLMVSGPFGIWWLRRRPCFPASTMPADWSAIRWMLTLAVAGVAAGILFNAVYWPFHGDDVLGIYGRYGQLMADTLALVPFAGRDDAFYQAYPIHIPLTYTYAFIISGWQNEYLARLFPALLSLGTLLTVYELGRQLYSERAGALAVLLLALTPTFARWASSGYVDLPMAFCFALAALFAWRWHHGGGGIDALLTGLLLGLAAWTKNAALLGIVLMGAWLLATAVVLRPVRWRHLLLMGFACALIVVPWYGRNWIEAGLLVPPTAWTDQAQRTLESAFILVLRFENYSVIGSIVMLGAAAGLWRLRRRTTTTAADSLLLILTIPFFGAWWLLVSYDPRFLLLFYPLLCVSGGVLLDKLREKMPELHPRAGWLPVAIVLLLLAYNLWISIEHKPDILRAPLMSDADKRGIIASDTGD